MADDILIKVGADVKGVITAIDTTTRLENRVKKLAKAYETGRVAPEQFNDALAKISKSAGIYSKSVETYSKSLQEANKAEKEAAAAAKAAKQEALALAKARKEQLAVERKAKEEARAFAQVRRQAEADNRAFDAQRKQEIATIKAQAAEEERLRRKYVEGYAAMDLYSKELNELAVARKAGIISTDQQRLAVERLNQQMASGTGVFSGYGKTMQEATTRNNRMGVVFQQTGYQVGDFLVQIQSGTNPMVAFGQQATQLAGVMTMFGGKMLIIGSVLGIVIPLMTAIGAAFMRSRLETDEARTSLQKYNDELRALQKNVSTEELEYIDKIAAARQKYQEEGLKFLTRSNRVGEESAALERGRMEDAKIALDLEKERYAEFLKIRAEITKRKTDEEWLLRNQENQLEAALEYFDAFVAGQQDAYAEAERLRNISAEITFSGAEASAQRLVERLGISVELARKLAGLGFGQEKQVILDPRDPNYDPIAAGMQDIDYGRVSPFDPSRQPREKTSRTSGGGGGGRAEENRMEQFIQSLMTERETLESWRSEQLDLLQQYNDKELAIIGGQAQARYRIEKEYEDRIRALKVNSLQNTASAVSGILSGLASFQDANNKKQFEKQKKYQTAAAVVDGISAAVSAWDKGMKQGGPFLAAAYTAGSLLKTGGLIKQIQSAQFSGGGAISGGGAPSGAAAAVPASVESAAPQRVIIEGIDRNSLISGEQLSNIFEALYKENENRGFVFEVAR